MIVLGLSGLHHAVDFKKEYFPSLDPKYHRVAQGFDSAAALIVDGQTVASASEERFTRVKGTERFPINAINYCLQEAGIELQEVDYIAHAFNYELYKHLFEADSYLSAKFQQVYSRQTQLNCLLQFLGEDVNDRFIQVPHHLAHAASAYYMSGFEKSLILVADGMGEVHSVSIAVGERDKITLLQQLPELHSLGIFYSIFTLFLGFDFNFDEYKVMGLAPYGNSSSYFSEIMQLIHLKSDGTLSIPVLYDNVSVSEKETYSKTIERLVELFGPVREPESCITQHHKDIAAALQQVLQVSLLHILRYYQQSTEIRNLCMAGGVALNCTANGYIKRSRLFNKLFIQPASGDDGAALGAALLVAAEQASLVRPKRIQMPYWGPAYSDQVIFDSLSNHKNLQVVKYVCEEQLAQEVAIRIAQGQVIGCFQHRMEMGPRALGNRSILADPRDPKMVAKINALIKKREDFRPFAPAVLAEKASIYFDIYPGEEQEYQHMLMITQVRDKFRTLLPAITHVDGSARVQTIIKDQAPTFWMLVNAFDNVTGIPIVLNTSFNVRGQPIVCTPEDAIETFHLAELDAMMIGTYLVTHAVQ